MDGALEITQNWQKSVPLAALGFIFKNNNNSSPILLENTCPVLGSCIVRCLTDRTGHPSGVELCYLTEGDYAVKTARWGLYINRICSAS